MVSNKRRNFLPTVIINLVLWIVFGLIIFFLNPNQNFKFHPAIGGTNFKLLIYPNIILFFLALTLSLTLTLALLFGNTRRGFVVSLILVVILCLRVTKVTEWYYYFLNIILGVIVEIFFSIKSIKGSASCSLTDMIK